MIYCDANASYPVEASHYDLVAARLKDVDGNPSSIHASGRQAKVALENARFSVAKMLGARAPEIVFTSGATEANNAVIQGVLNKKVLDQPLLESVKPHVVVTAVEHSSVLEPARLMADRGLCELSVAPVEATGQVDVAALLELVRPETVLVCVMHANNEMGAINPLRDVVEAVKQKNKSAHVHVDAVQMLGKADLGWYARAPIDSAAVSAHKLGGFKGVGALYLKAGTKLALLIAGGGQERGRRPGTENMPGIISFGIRCDELHGKECEFIRPMEALRAAWLDALRAIPEVIIHADPDRGLPNTVNFHVDGVTGDDILLNFDLAGIQASSGSACSSGANRPSHVLLALGYDEWIALNSVRVSFCSRGSLDDVRHMASVLRETIQRVRAT